MTTAACSTIRPAQLDRFRQLLSEIVPANRFYSHKLSEAGITPNDLHSAEDFSRIPFTTKAELTLDQTTHPPYGSFLTYRNEAYARFHQTSGTSTGQALRWPDTAKSWAWCLDCWDAYRSECFRITPTDRLFFPFSFGPFLGWWTAFESATRAGLMVLPAGGMPTTTRLRYMLEHRATILFATPTYALHMAEVAETEKLNLADSPIRAIIVAGEPGGTIESTRARIETAWSARVFDHYGMTEIGPAASEAADDPGHLYINTHEFIAEVLEPEGNDPVRPGIDGELVLTNLGRAGSPAIRYRTGDVVRLAADQHTRLGRKGWLRLDGGVRGRTDDMIHVRGNNLYPSAIEAVVRRFPEIAEFRITVDESGPLADVRVEIETAERPIATALARAIREELYFRAEVEAVPPGELPRYEMKAQRTIKRKK